jgi:enoyl-[acyl-carrier-protein] reductase (NADH)
MGFAYASLAAPIVTLSAQELEQQRIDAEALSARNQAQAAQNLATESANNLKNYSDKSNVDLTNQQKAWESASKFKQSDAAQQITGQKDLADIGNVAQKDRLTSQLTNQKDIQQAEFRQTNQLRQGDNERAVNTYKMNF